MRWDSGLSRAPAPKSNDLQVRRSVGQWVFGPRIGRAGPGIQSRRVGLAVFLAGCRKIGSGEAARGEARQAGGRAHGGVETPGEATGSAPQIAKPAQAGRSFTASAQIAEPAQAFG